MRLFHPFAPRGEVPGLVGRLAEWIEGEAEGLAESWEGLSAVGGIEAVDDELMEELERNGFAKAAAAGGRTAEWTRRRRPSCPPSR